MADVVNKKKRSEMMSGIGSKDTKPELFIRKSLHALGFRYKLHYNKLPGKPDIVFPKYKAIILINGCFWHRHNCHLFKWPQSNIDFWQKKITTNVERDKNNLDEYTKRGWKVLTIWECAIKGKYKKNQNELITEIVSWLKESNSNENLTCKVEGLI